ncbi:right-handed parallel beta-helix repeat-containing protein [Streptosporangium sp. KLBMP 9127]|nr:right-handed parallel beta-helix repeat-containing protein [Streptosporangium sp. KLBMP 9127]
MAGVLAASLAACTQTPPPPVKTAAPTLTAAVAECHDHPTPACTGVPPGTKLTKLKTNFYTSYRITEPDTVLDGVHVPGDLLITAKNVTIKNSQIDGTVIDFYDGKTYSFTITDSTVGPEKGCISVPGISTAQFTATRVHVRGHGDGFSVSGDNVKIQDSYVMLCSNPGDHSDGIQTYGPGRGLTFHHNTVDQRYAKDITAPIFLVDKGSVDVIVTNNLVMGGTYSIRVRNAKGKQIVRDNRVVDKTWVYGPIEADCSAIDWSGNTIVTIDADYRITSTVAPLPCDV